MKKMKKLASLALALVMALALAVPTFATSGEVVDPGDGTETQEPVNGSITIEAPDGATTGTEVKYEVYKVFDAVTDGTNISYKLVAGKTTVPAGFTLDKAGNVTYTANDGKTATSEGFVTALTSEDIEAIAAYVKDDEPAGTATSKDGADAVVSGLGAGYYYITTTTGSLVTINSAKPDATVEDKNSVPSIDKNAKDEQDASVKALVKKPGDTVPFVVEITVGKGAKNYAFHDKMTNLELVADSVKVSAVPTVTIEDWYTVKGTPDTGDSLTITFKDGIAEKTVITIEYDATVTSDALTIDPATNDASVSYGDNKQSVGISTDVKVYNATMTVTKTDGNNQPLDGAGFVITNEAGEYYKRVTANGKTTVTWEKDIKDATELTTVKGENGNVLTFTGLGIGKYTLIENTVPTGYNKALDVPFEVTGATETVNLVQSQTVVNNAGTVLPSTGGIGTTMFYVVGGLLVAGAGVLLVTKKRMGE